MEFGHLDRTIMRGWLASIKTTRLYVNSAVASEAEISATPTQQRAIDRLARRATHPLPDAASLQFDALPRCGSSPRSASAAVTQMGATVGWLQRNSGHSDKGRVRSEEGRVS